MFESFLVDGQCDSLTSQNLELECIIPQNFSDLVITFPQFVKFITCTSFLTCLVEFTFLISLVPTLLILLMFYIVTQACILSLFQMIRGDPKGIMGLNFTFPNNKYKLCYFTLSFLNYYFAIFLYKKTCYFFL